MGEKGLKYKRGDAGLKHEIIRRDDSGAHSVLKAFRLDIVRKDVSANDGRRYGRTDVKFLVFLASSRLF